MTEHIINITKPFAPLTSDFVFLSDEYMAPVVADYWKPDLHDWRVNHLPLIVGQAKNPLIESIETIIRHKKGRQLDFEPLLEIDIESTNPKLTQLEYQREVESKLYFHMDYSPIENSRVPDLSELFGKIIYATAEHDRHWFGCEPFVRLVVDMECGMVNARRGRHKDSSGEIHRDNSIGNFTEAETYRTYLFRSRFPTDCYPNALTEDIETNDLGKIIKKRKVKPISIPDGSIVLINEGIKGTAHKAHRPPQGKLQPSLFLRMTFESYR